MTVKVTAALVVDSVIAGPRLGGGGGGFERARGTLLARAPGALKARRRKAVPIPPSTGRRRWEHLVNTSAMTEPSTVWPTHYERAAQPVNSGGEQLRDPRVPGP